MKKQEVQVEGQRIALSNLEKVLYPATGFTKGQVIDYYTRVAPFILPHLKDRPVTLKRYPDGVDGKFFYAKDAPSFKPKWVRTFPVPRRGGGSPIRYLLINDLAMLVWCANLASLEIHPFLHRAPAIDSPTAIVFDLDPGEDADIRNCAEVSDPTEGPSRPAEAPVVSEGIGLQRDPALRASQHAHHVRRHQAVRTRSRRAARTAASRPRGFGDEQGHACREGLDRLEP